MVPLEHCDVRGRDRGVCTLLLLRMVWNHQKFRIVRLEKGWLQISRYTEVCRIQLELVYLFILK